jgi:hypothetical protein
MLSSLHITSVFGIFSTGGERMTEDKKSPAALVLLAWIVVGVPLGWGVYNTVRNSMKLFQTPAPPAHASILNPPSSYRV